MKQDVITLTDKQLNRITVIDQANKNFITVKEAAEALGLSERQVQRLKKKVREAGAEALIHKNSGRIPSNAISTEVKAKIISLKKSDLFADCNFTHFREILDEHYDIRISYAALHQLLGAQGLQSPKKRRRFKPHRRRERNPQAGLLLQTDATPFRWFKKDRKAYALHGAIDDATGQITSLYLTKNECMYGYIQMLKQTINHFGIPCSIYADRHTIFQSPNVEKAKLDDSIPVQETQFGRMLGELGIQLIPARSPQAKGRIERLWQTLQSRLPIEFAMQGIDNISAANQFLKQYIYQFNSEFAVEPKIAVSLFRKLPPKLDLELILCTKEQRTIDSGGVFSYYNKSFKVIETTETGRLPHKARVQVLANPDFGIKVLYRDTVFEVLRFIPPWRKTNPVAEEKKPRLYKPQPDSHCFKYGQSMVTPYDESVNDQAILSMLDELFLGDIKRVKF